MVQFSSFELDTIVIRLVIFILLFIVQLISIFNRWLHDNRVNDGYNEDYKAQRDRHREPGVINDPKCGVRPSANRRVIDDMNREPKGDGDGDGDLWELMPVLLTGKVYAETARLFSEAVAIIGTWCARACLCG